MSFTETIRKWLWTVLTPPEQAESELYRARVTQLATYRDYYEGLQKRQLKAKPGQADDNLTLNFIQLIVERSVSMMFGQGIEFQLPGEPESPNNVYIDECWSANNENLTLHKMAQFGSINGTCYVKIVPDGVTYRDRKYPRLVTLDPMLMSIETDPEDIDKVLAYVLRFVTEREGRETARKQETVAMLGVDGAVTGWQVNDYFSNNSTAGRWQLENSVAWPYEFAPIVHWQNLPQAGSVYGRSDIADVIELQDRINFIASNISKIIRYHAHPKTWGRMLGTRQDASWGPDELVGFQSPDATLQNLEMQSDLQSSQDYLLNLRQAFFDISRTPDFTSLTDKLGALTNFGLRVLFNDALAKNATKRELYGEALEEINRRMLIIGNVQPPDGGEVIWPEALPQSETEQVAGLQFDLQNGLTSKQTAAVRRGYVWEDEQERMEEEKAQGNNIGSMILQAFERGE